MAPHHRRLRLKAAYLNDHGIQPPALHPIDLMRKDQKRHNPPHHFDLNHDSAVVRKTRHMASGRRINLSLPEIISARSDDAAPTGRA
jgi:hypothetical protein